MRTLFVPSRARVWIFLIRRVIERFNWGEPSRAHIHRAAIVPIDLGTAEILATTDQEPQSVSRVRTAELDPELTSTCSERCSAICRASPT